MVMNTFRSKLRRRRDELLRRSSDESDEWQFVPFNPSVYPANNNNNITFNNNDGVGGILLGRMGREGEKEGRGREGKEGDCSSSSPKPALRPWALKRASWHDNYPPVPPHGHGSVVRRSFPLPRPPSRDSSPPPLPPHGQGYPGSVPPWYGAQFLHMASVNYPASVPPGQSRPENVVPKRDAQRVVTESDLTVAVSLNAPGKISASSVPSESSICSSVPKNVKVNTQSHGMGSPLYQEPTATPSTHSSGLTAIRGSFSNALDQSSFPNAASEDVSGPGTSRPNSSGSQPNSTNSMHSFDGVLPKGSQPGSMCSKTIAGIQVSPEGTPPPVPPHGRPTVPPHVGSPKVCVTMSASTLPPMPTVPLPPPPVPAHALTDINQLQKTNNDNLHQIVPSCSQGQEVSQYCPNSLPLNQLQHKYKHESIQSVNLIKCLQENQEHHIQSESAMNPPSQPINQSINKGVRELVSPGQAPPKYAHLNLDHLALFLGSVMGDKDPSPPPPPPPAPQHETKLIKLKNVKIPSQVTVQTNASVHPHVQQNSKVHGTQNSVVPSSVLEHFKIPPSIQKKSKVPIQCLQNSNVPSSVMQNAKTSASKVQSSKLPLSNLKSTSNVPTENPTSPGSPEYKTPVDQLPEYQSPTRGSPPSTTPMRTKKHKIHPPTRSKNRGSAYIPPSQKKKNNIPPTQVQNSRNTFVPPSTSVCAKSHRMGMQSQGSSSASAHNHNQITFPQKPGNTRGSPSIVSTRAQVHNFHTSCQSDSRVSPPTPPQRVVVPPSAPSRSLSADNPSQYFTSRTFSREPPSPALTQRTYSMDNPPPTPTRTVSIENPPPTPTRTLSMENPSLAITPMSYSNDNPDHSVSSNLKQHVTPRTFSTTTGNPTHTRTHSTGSIIVENLGHPFCTPRTFSMECPSYSFTQRNYITDSPPPVPTRTLSLGNVSAEQPPPTPTRTLSKEHSSKAFSSRNLATGNPSTNSTPTASHPSTHPHNQYMPSEMSHLNQHPPESSSSQLPPPPSPSQISLNPSQSSFPSLEFSCISSNPSQSFLPPFQSALPPSLSCPLLPSPPSQSDPLLPSPSSLPPSPSSLPPYQSLLPFIQSSLPPSLSFPLLPSPPPPSRSSSNPPSHSSLLPSLSLPLLPSPSQLPPPPPSLSSPLDFPPPPPMSHSEEESLHLLLPPPLFMSTNIQINKDSQVD